MRLRSLFVGMACIAWGTAVVSGFVAAERHAGTAGAAGRPVAEWPAGSTLTRDASRPTLLVFLHPRCPCSKATVEELSRLLARCGDRMRTEVVFATDPALGADWREGGTWQAVGELPGVLRHEDADGTQARLFGARTSGQALLFGADGATLFAGGLTAARGHAGDNPGEAAIRELVLHGRGARSAPVFGCALPAAAES